MDRASLCLVAFLLFATESLPAGDGETLRKALANASQNSTLILPGSPPFHMKLVVRESSHDLPEFHAEIEMWWKAPRIWRREVRGPAFSQTAVQNGERYFESDSSDYLPFWLHEVIQESVDPVPLVELIRESGDLSARGCAQWQEPYTKNDGAAYVHQSICFNPDGTVRELFTPTMNALLGNYQRFEEKNAVRTIAVWSGRTEIVSTVTSLERLESDDSRFAVSSTTPFPARLRFVSVPESALQLDPQVSAPLVWPVVHNFPASGVMAVNVEIDRAGAVREIGTIVSSNFVLIDAAKAQISKWKFKPHIVEGAPVQVNATLAIPFNAKMALLGDGGKSLPVEPFLARIKKSRELSDPREANGIPFRLHATIQNGSGSVGTYSETWLSTDKWNREILWGSAAVSLSNNGEKESQSRGGAKTFTPEIAELLDLLVAGHFPDRHYEIYEADWGQSAVTFEGIETVRVARGKVDATNHPISGQAYWFDAPGLLRGDYEEPVITFYSEFARFGTKDVPRRIEVTANGARKWLVLIDKLESISGDSAKE